MARSTSSGTPSTASATSSCSEIVTTQLGADGAGVFLVAVRAVQHHVEGLRIRRRNRTHPHDQPRPARRQAARAPRQHASRGRRSRSARRSSPRSRMYLLAPRLADIFASGKDVADDHRRAPRDRRRSLAFSSVYSVLCYGTRGFNTMVPQVCIEKIGRALAQPLAVLVVAPAGRRRRRAAQRRGRPCRWSGSCRPSSVFSPAAASRARATEPRRARLDAHRARVHVVQPAARARPGLPGCGGVDGHADHRRPSSARPTPASTRPARDIC